MERLRTLDLVGVLRIGGRVCVPRVRDWVRLFLDEAHYFRYFIHAGVTKMYLDL